ILFIIFFSSRRRHTRCLSDWSSDVCSSDLIKRDFVKQIQPIADRSRVNQKSVGQRQPQPSLCGEKCEVHERRRSQSGKRENDPTCIEAGGQKRQWRRNEKGDPGESYESGGEKLLRTDYKSEEGSRHQAVQLGEYVCIEMNLM